MELDRRNLLVSSAALAVTSMAGMTPALGASQTRYSGHYERLSAVAHFGPKQAVNGKKGIAITGHPLATQVAVDVLKEGGNACDALLAAVACQTVVEPHLTSITGCFSLLYQEAASAKAFYLNGNVNAPQALPDVLAPADVYTGRAVAVPGFWAGFEAAWGRFASLSLKHLLKPAISFARNGFPIHPFLWGEIFARQAAIGRPAEGRAIFFPNNVIPRPGDLLIQRAAAETLERLAEKGSDYFYHGDFARRFSDVVQQAGGVITPDDLARYEVRWEEPVRGSYRNFDLVCAAPPDIGGVHLIEILNMVELLDLKRLGPPTESLETLHEMMLMCREVLVDGARYGDPRYFPLPLDVILSKDYAAERHALLKTAVPREIPVAMPPGSCHLAVVDKWGNIATALHSTLSLPWANGLFVDGVSICAAGGHFLRTRPRPGGRASVMICPNLVLENGRPVLVSGSPSTSLLPAIVQNLTNILDFGISLEESVRRPRFGGLSEAVPGALWIEADIAEKLRDGLVQRGMPLDTLNPWHFFQGSFEAIHFPGNGMATACGDPRRTSAAMAVQ